MPHYQYACKDCGEHLEIVQSLKDDTLTECPGCGGRLRKLFSPIGIQFRGSGFYRTDSRRRSSEPSSDPKVGAGAGKGGTDNGGLDKGGTDKRRTDKGRPGTADGASAAKADRAPASSSSPEKSRAAAS